MTEQELREQIAKELEDYLREHIDIQPWIDIRSFRYCANLIRNKK